MERWTRRVVSHRKKILAGWVVLLVVGGLAAANLGGLLTNRFSVPGSDAERGLDLLKERFNERGDGAFTLVFRTDRPVAKSPAFRRQAFAAAERGASAVDGAEPGPVLPGSRRVAYVQIYTPLDNADAAEKTPDIRDALPQIRGATTYLSGYPAINHDTQKIYNDDLKRGESIAIPIALLVLAFMFGTLVAIGVPLAFAAVTIPSTLGAVWIVAHFMDMAVYVTNIVTLIGLAIAIDYSMLVVFRFREQLSAGDAPAQALERTMATAGRATLFSGLTVAVGLALLLLMPLPFMRSMGAGAVLIPLVSIAASATFLPALLSLLGMRVNRIRVVPRGLLERRASG